MGATVHGACFGNQNPYNASDSTRLSDRDA